MSKDAAVVLSWSGGKDSALALFALRKEHVPVRALLTTVTEGYERVSMHGVRIELVRKQADAVGVPLVEVSIPPDCPNEVYEARMDAALASPQLIDCHDYVFGDLFLEDVRAYREDRLAAAGKSGCWPLWGRDTDELAREFVRAGFKAFLVCVDPRSLAESFVGRQIDESFLADLPSGVDPCGERGEFHSFVYDGPIFTSRVECRTGEVVTRDGFVFCDVLSA